MDGLFQMMDKFNIYISYWKKGNESRVYPETVDTFLIDKFLEYHSKKNPNINFKFISIEGYEEYPNGWWPLVKLQNMLSLPQPMFHMDFDIFWNIDLEKLVYWLIEKDINVLYQSKDFQYTEYKYFRSKFPHVNTEDSYCGGITWWNNIDLHNIKTSVNNMSNSISKKINQLWLGMGLEQMYIPYELSKSYKIKTLKDIQDGITPFLHNMERIPVSILNDKQRSSIIKELNYYHFMTDFKNKPYFKNDIITWFKD